MARTKREQSPIGMYHVLLRSEENLFLSDNDKKEFEELCKKYFSDSKKLYSLVMMPDRIHLVFSDGGEGISQIIKPLTTSYARYYNRTYNRTGKLFTDRYKSSAATDKSEIADSVLYLESTYAVSSAADKKAFFADICEKSEYEKRMSGKLERVCLDSFDAFSKKEIISIISRMSGVGEDELLKMTDAQKKTAIRTAASSKWVSMRRMSEALGVAGSVPAADKEKETRTPMPKQTPTPKASAKKSEKSKEKIDKKPEAIQEEKQNNKPEEKPKKQNLSVWLL